MSLLPVFSFLFRGFFLLVRVFFAWFLCFGFMEVLLVMECVVSEAVVKG